ncbi:hypothetical protein B9G69_013095 [Bdellovibrio sp. SKB1291214]|uniref:hypothetical protein n=1 Tax=Bdellovibrio sp. SKB1291214 TaxID=1732569 RepID=UPI000B516B8A|nr:hypothetical protein [Bdellovibrio sp. SKB1291214]UYL07981.1 hypothetical protein B9G69_013095 [Bdellovibrio sp. SKB1291214]
MNLYAYLNAQHTSALKKAEHISRLPKQDKYSRKIFLDDLIRHLNSLFLAEQVSLYAAVEQFATSTNFLESSLRNQEMVMSKLKSYALDPHDDDNIPHLLHTYNSNQQAYVFPVFKKHVNADTEYALGNFSAQFYDQVFRDVHSRDAFMRTAAHLPGNLKERARQRLEQVLHPYPLHHTA